MKQIVVIGGSGFMGGRLVTHLASSGYGVTSISRSPSPSAPAIPGATHIDCQYDNMEQLADVYRGADVIFHLAWDTTPSTSARSPLLEITGNLLPFARFLEYLQERCAAQLVFVSSGGTVYGSHLERSASENDRLQPISYYGAAKVAVEHFIKVFADQGERSAIVLRPSNVYGPGQLPKRQFGVIPTLMKAIREDLPFTLIGGREISRDFLFVDDFVSACQRIIELGPLSSSSATTLNLASGDPVLILDLVKMVEEVTGCRVNLADAEPRAVDVSRVSLDTEEAKRVLGWMPKVALREGLEKTWEWFQRGNR